jgi:hypothetical protein
VMIQCVIGVVVVLAGAVFTPTGMRYASPVVSSVSPSVWSAAAVSTSTFHVLGSGLFAASSVASSASVWVIPDYNTSVSGLSTAWCASGSSDVSSSWAGSGLGAPQLASPVSVLSDDDLTFAVPSWGSLGRMYSGAYVVVSVMSQSVASAVHVTFEGPSIASLSFGLQKPNGTHNFVVIQGNNFGSSVASPPSMCTSSGSVAVTIGSTLCEELVMLIVCRLVDASS